MADNSTDLRTLVPVPALLRICLHVLVAALLVLACGRALIDRTGDEVAVIVTAVVVAAIYAIGPRAAAVARSVPAAGLWLAILLLAWLVLLALTPDAIYLAFAWFFLLLHLLPRPIGLAAVVVVAAAAIAGFGRHQDRFTVAMVIGPLLGAAVVVATVWGYQVLQAESDHRRRLIGELEHTRAELATAERDAGMLGERERLAREIHDTLAQGLSSIQLLLLAAGRSLDADRGIDPERAVGLVEHARSTAQDNLAEARRFVRALTPLELSGSSLVPALQRLCDTTATKTELAVSFRQVGPDVVLATTVEIALLRIAQAALGNTELHAQGTRADVTLTVMDEIVTLDIVDDGAGFDPAAPGTSDGGFGLTSMRSRAAELGGRLTVESEDGNGTAISVSVPIAPEKVSS